MGYLDDLLEKRRTGNTDSRDLILLLRALAELHSSEPELRTEAERYGPVAVNFQVPGKAAAQLQVSGGTIRASPGLDPGADLVVEVPEDLAREMVTGNPSGVLWRGVSTGAFRVKGDVKRLLALIPLFDAVLHRFGEESLFGKT